MSRIDPATADLFTPPSTDYRVPFDGAFRVAGAATAPSDDAPGKKASRQALDNSIAQLYRLQRALYADNRFALLCVFQAIDAAGKDSTIRRVFSGVNPAGFQVSSFKAPSSQELDHDFLWRSARRLPERGRIGVFNRSYYEEVLVVRVHPKFLGPQRLPRHPEAMWEERFESIRDHELHLARNGTVILKFWLHLSREEQHRRFLDRIENPVKNWKFSEGDLDESERWNDYMAAFEDALNATSRPWAPWYAIPADNKPYMRMTVARIVQKTLEALPLRYPELDPETVGRLPEIRKRLIV